MKISGILLAAVLGLAGPASSQMGTDCHMHVHPQGEGDAFDYGATRVLSALEGAGLQRGCILSEGYRKTDDRAWTQKADDWTLEQAAKSPDLIPFCGVPIKAPWAPEEVARCAAKGGRGLKLHPVSEGLSLVDATAYAALEKVTDAAIKAKLPILIHISLTDPKEAEALFRLAASRPQATIIAAHELGPNFALLTKAPPNVYVDISGLVLAPRAAAPKFVALWRAVGMRRILLGSDWPMLHPSEYMAALRAFPLTEEERKLVIEGNALRLLPPSSK